MRHHGQIIRSLLLLSGIFTGVNAQSVWTLNRNPALHSVASAGSLFAAVGDSGFIQTSPDGVTWTTRLSGITGPLYSIAYSGGQFAAVGSGGAILTSSNGITWTSRTSGTTNAMYSVTYGGGQFAAVGSGGAVLTSSNGTTWTQRASGVSSNLLSVIWTGSEFVVVGGTNTVLTSPDGVIWTTRSYGATNTLASVAWTGAQFVAVGYNGTIFTSPDAQVWTQRFSGTSNDLYSVTWMGTQFAAAGASGTVLTSADGLSWTGRSSGTINILWSVVWTGSQLVSVGNSGTILTWSDGAAWLTHSSGTTNTLLSVCWSGSQLITVGANGTLLTSSDGATWTTRAAGTSAVLWSVAWGGSQFIAAGNGGVILTSPDGVTWTSRVSGTSSTLYSIAWIDIQWVATGANGVILTSPDGVTWTPQSSGTTNNLYSITWTGSVMATVGAGGVVLTSLNGVNWVQRSSGTSNNLNSILWTNGQFVAIGGTGIILTSADAITWTARSSGTTNDLSSIVWTGIQLVTVGGSGTVLLSEDGAAWIPRSSGTTNILSSVVWTGSKITPQSGGQFVAVGYNGSILNSPQDPIPQAPTLSSPAQNSVNAPVSITLTWNAYIGATSYRVQLSSDSTFSSTEVNDSVAVPSRAITGLLNSTTYYWRVNATNALGTSAYSAKWLFTTSATVPGAPTLSMPDDGTLNISASPTLSWNAINGAISYQLQISTDPNFGSTYLNDQNITTPMRAIVSLENGTKYYWRVNAKNGAGTGAFSAVWSFTTVAAPPAPTLSTPINNAVNVAIPTSLTWTAVSGATSYRVQIAVNPSFTSIKVDDSTLTSTILTTSSLLNNTYYYWRVSAKSSGVTNGFSTVWSFTTIVTAPAAPSPLTPTNNATSVPIPPTLTWNAIGDATSYHVQLSTSSTFATTLIDDSTLTTATKIAAGLATNSVYYWKVGAKSAGGTGPYSATWSFTTSPPTGILPREFEMQSLNFENTKSIRFSLPLRTQITIRLFNSQGRMVAQLLNETREAGSYSIPLPTELKDSYNLLDFRAGNYHKTLKLNP